MGQVNLRCLFRMLTTQYRAYNLTRSRLRPPLTITGSRCVVLFRMLATQYSAYNLTRYPDPLAPC